MPGLEKNGNSLTIEEKNNFINELGLGAIVAVDPVSGVTGLNPVAEPLAGKPNVGGIIIVYDR